MECIERFSRIDIITMKRACYEKFARLRGRSLAMQPIDALWQYILHGSEPVSPLIMNI